MGLLELVTDAWLALLPVVLFLAALIYMDSFKLVRGRSILSLLLVGAGAAVAAFWINPALFTSLSWEFENFTRFGSPPIEESLKAVPLVWLLWRNRIGFPIDAAIYGFAVGTGFAVTENASYLRAHPEAHQLVWVIRGFGTALLHGGSAVTFAILARTRAGSSIPLAVSILPAWLAAVVIHSFYNHFFLPPLASTLLILLTLPVLVGALFVGSEKALRKWLTAGFDADADMIALLDSGNFRDSRVGEYLRRLRRRFPGEVVADMLCFLRLHTELSLRAKGLLMLRDQGFEPPSDPQVGEKLKELDYLAATIGKTGMRVLLPLLGAQSRDSWQLFWLERNR